MITARNGTRLLSRALGRSTRSRIPMACVPTAQSHLFSSVTGIHSNNLNTTRSYSTEKPVEEKNDEQAQKVMETEKVQPQQDAETWKEDLTKKARSGYHLKRMPRVAVLMAGCGYLDGVDIQEAVSIMLHFGERDIAVTHFTPYGNMENIYNHSTRELDKKEYRVFEKESTRITRLKPVNAKAFKANDFDALVIPGGLGWFRNTSNLEQEQLDLTDFESNEDVNRMIKEFHALQKPIFTTSTGVGAVGIALSKRNGGPGLKHYTLGNEGSYGELLKKLGNAEDEEVAAREILKDEQNNVWSTPGMAGFLSPQPEVVHKYLGKYCDTIFDIMAKDIGLKEQ